MKLIIHLLPLFLLAAACNYRQTGSVPELTPMQQDSLYRIELENADHSEQDSLLTARLGKPTTCISRLRDYCKVGDEYWYVNLTFGMALQLPDGFIPSEWANLETVSYGAEITNPDVPIIILVSSFPDVLEPEDREELLWLEREAHPDYYIRQVVAQGVVYTLTVIHEKGSEREFKAMLPYLERFPEGPCGMVPLK